MVSERQAYRRRQSRLSTVAGLGGITLIVVGVVLTVYRVGGNMLPTVLALVGVCSLMAAVATGAMLIAENVRYHQNQSYYDDE